MDFKKRLDTQEDMRTNSIYPLDRDNSYLKTYQPNFNPVSYNVNSFSSESQDNHAPRQELYSKVSLIRSKIDTIKSPNNSKNLTIFS